MKKIVDRIDCCGCAACAAICTHQAISMKEEEDGFLYPSFNQDICVDCGLCKTVCPIIKRDSEDYIVEEQEYYACHNDEEKEWKASSSGGIFRVIADYVIQHGGFVAGAVYDEDFVVRHFLTNKNEDLEKFRGSKYVQSDTRHIFKEVKDALKTGRLVLFTGTPCQVEAIKSYLKRPYENLLTCDLICTSVPSPLVFHDYITFLEKKYGSKVVKVNMKDKTKGWPLAKTRIFFKNGMNIYNNIDADLWVTAWATKLFNRTSCEHCRFTNYNRPGDLTIGDCWPVYHKKHPFSSPNGISQLMVNTSKGRLVFENIKEKMTIWQISKNFAWQSKLEYPIDSNTRKDEFWSDYHKKSFKEIAIKYWNYRPFADFQKKFLSLIKRIMVLCKQIFSK